MRVLLILAAIGLAAAAPKTTKLNFRNLYKDLPDGVVPKQAPRIIGGQEATPHSIPYQAFIQVSDSSSSWVCGASVISANYILTAAHCGDGGTSAIVVLGAHKPLQSESTQVVLQSFSIKIHENYDSVEIVNDIAVIRLPRAITFNTNIQPIKLPRRADQSNTYAGQRGRISGWGLTNGQGSQISSVLNYVDTNIISNIECQSQFGFSLPSSNICTSGSAGTGSCNGDSGGPLVVSGVQVGIVSFGIRYCPAGYPSAFARVTSYLDWIQRNSDVVIS